MKYFRKIRNWACLLLMPVLLGISLSDGQLPVVCANVVYDAQTAGMAGSGTQTDPYIIYDDKDLYDFAAAVNSKTADYANAYVELANDVDVSAYNWPGIGRYGSTSLNRIAFSGYFDGKGHIISGLQGSQSVGSAYQGYGLFGYLSGTVTNVKIMLGGEFINGINNGGTTSKNAYIGIIAGWAEGTSKGAARITNCEVDGGGFLVQSDIEAGGIAGHAERYVTIENCNVKNIEVQARYEAAGIAGRIKYDTQIKNCTVNNGSFTVTGGGYAAGLIGIVEGGSGYGLNYIDNCHTYNITARASGNYTAGLIGACRYGRVTNSGAANVNAYGLAWHGGAFGAIYNGSEVDSCYAKDVTIASSSTESWGLGGFAGAIYTDSTSAPSLVTNCYAADGRVISSGPYGTGGFVGMMWSNSQIHRSYAQVDVFANGTNSSVSMYSGQGGFVGNAYGSNTITNCYASGSVTVHGNYYAGGFAGNFSGTGVRVGASFGTGTVRTEYPARAGGFAGNAAAAGMISESFYDTTTTRCKGTGVGAGNANQGITGLSTTDMTDIDNFSTWGIQENFLGKAGSGGSDSNPWYIDDNITYPYLYHQFDGHTKADTNYVIASTTYQDGDGIAQSRADFSAQRDSLPLRSLSMGAVKAYLPYSGISRYDISSSTYSNIPGAAYDSRLYSLGGVSETNIIAFNGAPYAKKSSDRERWDAEDRDTYTYVGDVVTYYVTVWNYDIESDFKDVTVADTILDCVTLLPDSITINEGESYDPDAAVPLTTASDQESYYAYDESRGKLTVHLEDMPKADITTGTVSSYTISFKVTVEKDAASVFTSATDYRGDIENEAVLGGKLWYANAAGGVDYSYKFSDDNLDPVYDAYLFRFYKVDANHTSKKLKGAEFSLYKYTGNGKPNSVIDTDNLTSDWELCTVTRTSTETALLSGEDGLVSYFQITEYPGYYMLVETQKPRGYLESDCQWLVEVSGDASSITTATIKDSDAQIVNDFTSITEAGGKKYYQLGNNPISSVSKTVIDGGAEENTENKAWSVNVGEEVTYKITVVMPPDFYGGAEPKTYTQFDVYDIPSSGLQIDFSSIEVKVGGVTVTKGASGMPSDFSDANGFTVSLVNIDRDASIHEKVVAGAVVEITYKATVTPAGIGQDITNAVRIRYDYEGSNGAGTVAPDPEDPDPVLYTYSHAVLKVEENRSIPLNGAEFIVKLSNGSYLRLNDNGNGWSEVADQSDAAVFTSGGSYPLATLTSDGYFSVIGVKGGVHQLIETKAPAGYTLLKEPIDIAFNQASTDTHQEGLYTTQIVNVKGFALPRSGGAGTLTYTAAGIALLVAGLILYVRRSSRKRGEMKKM